MQRPKLAFRFSAVGCLLFVLWGEAADRGLFEAIHADDAGTVKALLKRGADPNTRDDIGATALMHAAAFSSSDCLRALLDGGADLNSTSNSGATALMWATGDARKVRLLASATAWATMALTYAL